MPKSTFLSESRQWYLFLALAGTAIFGAAIYFLIDGKYVFVGLAGAFAVACVALLIDQKTLVVASLVGPPTVFVFINNEIPPLPFLTMGRLIFVLLFAPLVIGTIYRRRSATPMMMLERLILIFMSIIMASLFFGLPSRPSEQWGPDISMFFQAYLMPMVGFILIRRLSWRPENMDKLFITLAITGAVTGIVAIVYSATGVNLLEPTWIETNPEHAERATGPFANPTEFGGVALIGMVAGIWVLRGAHRGRIAWVVPAIVLSLACILLSQTRAVWLGALISICMLAYYDRRVLKFVFGPAILAMAATAVLAPFVLGSGQFQERFSEVSPIYNRLTSLTTAGNVISDFPLTGVGFGKKEFELAKPGRYADFGGVSGSYAVKLGPPHNEWLHVTAMLGIPAGILHLVIWILLGRTLWRIAILDVRQKGREVGGVPVFAIFAVTILYTLLVDTGFFVYIPYATWALAAIVIKAKAEAKA